MRPYLPGDPFADVVDYQLRSVTGLVQDLSKRTGHTSRDTTIQISEKATHRMMQKTAEIQKWFCEAYDLKHCSEWRLDMQVFRVVDLLCQGYSFREISKIEGISKDGVYRIAKRMKKFMEDARH